MGLPVHHLAEDVIGPSQRVDIVTFTMSIATLFQLALRLAMNLRVVRKVLRAIYLPPTAHSLTPTVDVGVGFG